jgi:sialate O-acetylesterase
MFRFNLPLLALLSLLPVHAQDVRITEGISDYQVLQRGPDQTATLHFAGTAAGKKIAGKNIDARLISGDAPLAGFDWTTVGRVQKSTMWSAEFPGVPVGGPYRLEVRMQGSDTVVSISNLLVGDLWVLAGQSNMEGYGNLIDVQPPNPMVHNFEMSDRWTLAEEPLHTLVNAVDRVHWPLNANKEPERWTGGRMEKYRVDRRKGAGLGLSFAVEMANRTRVPIGLIPCAHGGTSMDQWDPALKEHEGDSLYGSMLRRFRASGGHIRGMLWYQGESDANPKAVEEFPRKFADFVKTVRADFGDTALPFYYVQLGRHIANTDVREWNQIQAAQLRAESEIPNVAMVASVDLQLEDGIHVATPDLKRLGRRLADLACHDLFPRAGDFAERKRGPRPAAAKVSGSVVRVTFSGVNGRLESEGRISGFTIHDASGEPIPRIFKARVDPAEASTVLLYITGKLPDRATLRYGYTRDPYCNLHDAADQAVPVFGPMTIE